MQWTKFLYLDGNYSICIFQWYSTLLLLLFSTDSSWKYFIIKIIKTVYKQLSFVQLQTVSISILKINIV